jgi:hypothetical protein
LSGHFHGPAALPTGKNPWCPTNRRLGMSERRCGHLGGGGKKISLALPGFEPRASLSSFCLSYGRFVASSKTNSPQSAIWCFRFQFPVAFLFLKVIQWLLTYYSSSSRHFYPSLYLSFINMFEKTIPTQYVTNPVSFILFIVCRVFLSSLTI